ncbi:hypothetical protein ACTWKD_08605 [Halanaerobium saccharolyticum]|jgi:hypothetical protein|uniref:hypothetical protein n=1 Tax=Halanaerobium saccharolyticum TaxID=43595 RepID=UPI003FCC9521
MKKKVSLLLVMALLVFAVTPAVTFAQEATEDAQEEVVADEEETVNEEEESTEDPVDEEETVNEEEENTEDPVDEEDMEDELKEDYQNLEELLADLETTEELNSVEKITLERKLIEYDESLDIKSISSVVDKILAEEIDLGQGFVILNNIEESVNNGYEEEKALKLINSYQSEEDDGQFAFQTALELRKLSREDSEKTAEFAEELSSIIEENGNIETSELKQLAAEYRKEAREEKREQNQINKDEKNNSDAKNDVEKSKENNAAKNALDKANNGKGNSNSAKADKDKSPNSNADQNSAK